MCEITLSPCPFCGGAAFERLDGRPGGGFDADPSDVFSVGCQSCGIQFSDSHWPGHITETAKDAVRAKWNRRAQPMQPLVVGKHGVVRFKENRIVSAVLDVSYSKGYFGLNQIACGDYTPEERMQFAQLIGYSVSGYGDLSYASKESIAQADALAEALVAQKDPS